MTESNATCLVCGGGLQLQEQEAECTDCGAKYNAEMKLVSMPTKDVPMERLERRMKLVTAAATETMDRIEDKLKYKTDVLGIVDFWLAELEKSGGKADMSSIAELRKKVKDARDR